MKTITIILLLALAGCSKKPEPKVIYASIGWIFAALDAPADAECLKLEPQDAFSRGCQTNQLSAGLPASAYAPAKHQSKSANFNSCADKKNWDKPECQVQGIGDSGLFDGSANLTFVNCNEKPEDPGCELSFTFAGFSTYDFSIHFSLDAKTEEDRWRSVFKSETKWAFHIDGADYQLTGKELADAVKVAKVDESKPPLPPSGEIICWLSDGKRKCIDSAANELCVPKQVDGVFVPSDCPK